MFTNPLYVAEGSSPLARGTRKLIRKGDPAHGLIPARAGNTRAHCPAIQLDGAHPRSRGEHVDPREQSVRGWGSSPLARGTRQDRTAAASTGGLIPARAGNTLPESTARWWNRAHPRSRGEHRAGDLRRNTSRGSSPLARGTRVVTPRKPGAVGLIPARAGNTSQQGRKPSCPRAHPRSRGEHPGADTAGAGDMGSSPLARGTHLLTWDFTPYISKIESLWSQSLTPEYTISSHY